MSISIADAVRQLVHNKGISEELILKTVEDALLKAYEKRFGHTKNAETVVDEEKGVVYIYSRKEVVDEVADELTEISLEEAKGIDSSCEIEDEVLIEVSPAELGRIAAQQAKQIIIQRIREIEKNLIYNEYKQKENELVSGHFQREKNGNIFIDLGRTEALLPRSEQSPKEYFSVGDRIKALILEVKGQKENPIEEKRDFRRESKFGCQVILSRAHPDFVRRVFENEVPEISDGTVTIMGVVRDPGFRTKIAVYSKDIDPVGACVGIKGIRIQSVIKELFGEKIDIVRYSDDVREYIQNSLSPAVVERVLILDEDDKQALAIVEDDKLSLAIGKQGQNVRLASKLVGWHIDVKTIDEYKESDYEDVTVGIARGLFSEEDTDDVSEHHLGILSGLNEGIIRKLEEAGITTVEDLIEKTKDELQEIPGIGPKTSDLIIEIIKENVVIVDEEEEKETSESEEGDAAEDKEEVEAYIYYCPECNAEISDSMTKCPGCGVELEFE